MILSLVVGVVAVFTLLASAAIPASLTEKLFQIFFKGDSQC